MTNKKISHLANCEIGQMADASGGIFLYTYSNIISFDSNNLDEGSYASTLVRTK